MTEKDYFAVEKVSSNSRKTGWGTKFGKFLPLGGKKTFFSMEKLSRQK